MHGYLVIALIFAGVAGLVQSHGFHHPTVDRVRRSTVPAEEGIDTASYWLQDAQQSLKQKVKAPLLKGQAKNVIFFLGDGMSIETATAARILSGQLEGKLGERSKLSFEEFPYAGLSKTFCVNRQVADSACTSTAYLCGIKANFATIGVTGNVTLNDCLAGQEPVNQVQSIASWAQKANKGTGIVTTTTVTNASPAGAYAHVAHRDYESDLYVKRRGNDPAVCQDIAQQLVEGEVGKQLNVILGGGTKRFLPNGTIDINGNAGERLDGRNLIKEWLASKKKTAEAVFNRDQLLAVECNKTNFLLGLFTEQEMTYAADADMTKEPSLAEMTQAAIKVLEKNKNGFFLFVEGGRIDHGHHQNLAQKALIETVEFSKAVKMALDMTNDEETLIVVTADHGHTMSMSGYPVINNNILGLSNDLSDLDGLPYTTLSYANGPSYYQHLTSDKSRLDLNTVNMIDKDFKYAATFPSKDETHGGGDVAVYAKGPWAHLFSGVNEQNVIPHLMAYAACIGDGYTMCQKEY